MNQSFIQNQNSLLQNLTRPHKHYNITIAIRPTKFIFPIINSKVVHIIIDSKIFHILDSRRCKLITGRRTLQCTQISIINVRTTRERPIRGAHSFGWGPWELPHTTGNRLRKDDGFSIGVIVGGGDDGDAAPFLWRTRKQPVPVPCRSENAIIHRNMIIVKKQILFRLYLVTVPLKRFNARNVRDALNSTNKCRLSLS